jgi:hypothetical protein
MRDHPAESNEAAAAVSLHAEVEELRRRLAALEARAPRQAAGRTAARNRPTTKRLALLVAGVVLAGATVVFGQSGVEALFVSKKGNVGIGTNEPGESKLRIANSAGDFVDVRFPQNGGGLLDIVGWEYGWNINTASGGKNLYLNRDVGETSNVLIGRKGKELIVRGSNGNVEVAGRVKVKEIEFSDGGIQTGSLPAHAVMAFNLTSCPAGWTEYAPARGRFVRGIDTTGSRNTDPDGRRQPGGTQEDAIRNITGALYGVMGGYLNAWQWGFRAVPDGAFSVDRTGETYNRFNGDYKPEGGIGSRAAFNAANVVPTAPENRPKNVSLLYCEKQ